MSKGDAGDVGDAGDAGDSEKVSKCHSDAMTTQRTITMAGT
jgi:hypothetical protein